MKKQHTLRLIPALLMGAFAGSAGAAGFALQNQNGSGNGNAFAGVAAVAEDAGTIFFNPAGMTYLPEGHSLSVAGTVLNRSIDFNNAGTTAMPTGFPLGTNGGDGGGTALIPAAYYAYSISPRLRIGVGLSPTFGNKTQYDETFIGRFSGYFAELKQINLNPSIAYRLNDTVSLGFGLNYAKNEVEFRQMIPVGAATQSIGTLEGDDTAWGYNLGALFQLNPETRLGLAYRSRITFHLEGTQNVQGLVLNRPIKAELETPDNLSLALQHKLNDRWELLADATWTYWSSIKSIVVYNGTTGARITSLDYNFRDTYRVGLGANYQMNDAWRLRFGVAYDKTPVPSDVDRTMTLPDSDRTWLSFGVRYTLSPQSTLDLGYSHIFFKDAPTARTVAFGGPFTQTVRGNFDTSADLLSVQYNVHF
ncbi:MAG: aromatic hydrocarbon degradation protein [Betaproteobacteria bacterium HGW-Betaproteobacteria-11]|nr:MAG: aromatic hydrocarbon degradation protein [Betaproteobacteria bacterium HGW-Betaproteobacteria-11]